METKNQTLRVGTEFIVTVRVNTKSRTNFGLIFRITSETPINGHEAIAKAKICALKRTVISPDMIREPILSLGNGSSAEMTVEAI